MYLVDTDVVSEARRGSKANPGVKRFFKNAVRDDSRVYVSVVTIGELRQGIEKIRHRGDGPQAVKLEKWFAMLVEMYANQILEFDRENAQLWGRLRVPNPENPLDKQIAALALTYDLVVVTRNIAHFRHTGARLMNPFQD